MHARRFVPAILATTLLALAILPPWALTTPEASAKGPKGIQVVQIEDVSNIDLHDSSDLDLMLTADEAQQLPVPLLDPLKTWAVDITTVTTPNAANEFQRVTNRFDIRINEVTGQRTMWFVAGEDWFGPSDEGPASRLIKLVNNASPMMLPGWSFGLISFRYENRRVLCPANTLDVFTACLASLHDITVPDTSSFGSAAGGLDKARQVILDARGADRLTNNLDIVVLIDEQFPYSTEATPVECQTTKKEWTICAARRLKMMPRTLLATICYFCFDGPETPQAMANGKWYGNVGDPERLADTTKLPATRYLVAWGIPTRGIGLGDRGWYDGRLVEFPHSCQSGVGSSHGANDLVYMGCSWPTTSIITETGWLRVDTMPLECGGCENGSPQVTWEIDWIDKFNESMMTSAATSYVTVLKMAFRAFLPQVGWALPNPCPPGFVLTSDGRCMR